MEKRILGNGFEVSAVGLGCMGFSHAYGAPTDREEAVSGIRSAYEMGYSFFDTAEVYGTLENPHHNEELVGEALKWVRGQVQIASKFGIHFDMDSSQVNHPLIPDSRRQVIHASVEGSLKRLQTDHIDLYFQHRIDPAVEPEEVADTMAELIREGKILHWGISEANEEYLRRAHAVCPVTAVEFDKKYDYRSNMPQFTDEAIDKNRKLLELLHTIAENKDATPAQVSMAWMLCKKPWIVPIPGTRKIERMRENAGAVQVKLTKEEVQTLDTILNDMEMSEVFGGSRIIKS